MNNEENNFEEFLRAKLENHSVKVHDSVWADIEKRQKKREGFIWFKQYLNVFFALDIVFILGFSVLSTLNSNDVQSKNKAQNFVQIKPDTNVVVASTSTEANAKTPTPKPFNKQKLAYTSSEINKTTTLENPIKNTKTKSPTKDISNANSGIAANKNKLIPSKRTNKNPKKSNAPRFINEVLHDDIINEIKSANIAIYANIQPLALHPLNNTNQYNFSINESKKDVVYPPPSISQSKPKKVLKAEQNAITQSNKALAKQAKDEQKAIANKEAEQTEKVTNQNKIDDAVLVTNENDIAPLALDTIYGKKKFKGYFAIDALISPELCGRTLNASNQQVQDYISRRDSAEKVRISYSALLRLNLFINRNIFINSGISFSQRTEKFSIEHKWETHEDYIDSSKFITIIDPFTGSTIYKTYDTLDYVRTSKENLNHNLTMTFIDVPVMIGYKWLGKRAGIAVQGGVVFNLLFKQKGTIANFNYTANDVSSTTQNPFNATTGLSLAGGISSNYKLTNKLDLLIEPHTRYVLKPINNASYPLQQKIFVYGLNVGLRLKL
jgi:hypothetical protein